MRLASKPAQRWSSASDFRRCGDAFGNETTVTAVVDEGTGRVLVLAIPIVSGLAAYALLVILVGALRPRDRARAWTRRTA